MKFLKFLYAAYTYIITAVVLLVFFLFFQNISYLGHTASLPTDSPFSWQSLFWNIGLLTLFGVQHSVMARDWFKEWIKFLVPSALERITYIMLTSLVIALIVWQWQPFGGVLWDFRGEVLGYIMLAFSSIGLMITAISATLISSKSFIGLEQLTSISGQTDKEFVMPLFYQYVRHPIYFGLLLTFWTIPLMSWSGLVFTIGMTIYIAVGSFFEERNLVQTFGETYRVYQQQVPMLIPFLKI